MSSTSSSNLLASTSTALGMQLLLGVRILRSSKASELAPQIASDWSIRTRARYMNAMNTPSLPAPQQQRRYSTSETQPPVYAPRQAVMPPLASQPPELVQPNSNGNGHKA